MYDPESEDEVHELDPTAAESPAGEDPRQGPWVPCFRPQPWIMGILNVTPDSFSDGGRWAATEDAVARGLALVADGADLVDVGGESTRPGAHRVDAQEEIDRVVPVITALAARGVQCSVDTTRSVVAAAALEAGAVLVNDVSGGLADPDMVRVVADSGAPWVLMHWRGHSDEMDQLARYRDVSREVVAELSRQVDLALAAGVSERALILDPGLGFAKTAAHNWELLYHLDDLTATGLPVLVGASRKRFLGQLLADPDPTVADPELDLGVAPPPWARPGVPRPVGGREFATAAVSQVAAAAGVWGVRVHEPQPTADAFAVLGALAHLRAEDAQRDLIGVMDALGEPWPDRPLVRLDEVGLDRMWWRPLRTGAWNPPEVDLDEVYGGDPADPREDLVRPERPEGYYDGSRRHPWFDRRHRG